MQTTENWKMMKTLDILRNSWTESQKAALLLFYFSLLTIGFAVAELEPELREYCTTQTFEAKCDEDQVIVMKHAMYGRMRLGICIQNPYDEIGCQANVLAIFDSKCSGRRHCQVLVPDKEIHELSPCTQQLVMYLEAAYSCLRIYQNIPSKCSSSIPQPLTEELGYIAHTHSTNYKCSWSIRLLPGLRINITLLDFGTSRFSTASGGSIVPQIDCYLYAFIKETTITKVNVCSGHEREKVVYLSETNSVEIQTLPFRGDRTEKSDVVGAAGGRFSDDKHLTKSHDNEAVRYILRYEAVGCADLKDTSRHMIVYRMERNKMFLACDNASKPHYLVCVNREWNGTRPVCSQHSSQLDSGSGFWTKVTSDWVHAILITVAIGMTLGIIIGVALLVALMAYLKRKDRRKIIRDQSLHPTVQQYYSRSVRAAHENNEVQIYYERSRTALESEVKLVAPPGECMQDSWLLMGHHAPQTDDVICSCPASGKLMPSPGGRLTERQLMENQFSRRKAHQTTAEHVYEMTC